MKKAIRNSNVELMRIFSMIMIMIHHYAMFTNINTELYSNNLIKFLLLSVGKIGVNIFIIISGYYMIKSKFNLKRLLKLILEVWFYSILGIAIYIIFFGGKLCDIDILANLTPIVHTNNWFVTAYVILYIFSNYINILIENITKKQHIILLIILFVLFSVFPTFFNISIYYNEIWWFIFLYLLAAYCRLYKDSFNTSLKLNLICCIVFCLIYFITVIHGVNNNYAYQDILKFADMNKIPCLIISLNMFLIAVNMKEKNFKLINRISSFNFGVCLLHENNLLYPIYWKKFFDNSTINSGALIIHAMVSIVIIYLICIIVDYIRQIIFNLGTLCINKIFGKET